MAPNTESGRAAPKDPVCKACGRHVPITDGKFAMHWKGAPGVMCPGTGKPLTTRTDLTKDQALLHDPRGGGVRLLTVYPNPDWAEGVPP